MRPQEASLRLSRRPRPAVRAFVLLLGSWNSAALHRYGPSGYNAVYRNSQQEYTTNRSGAASQRGGAWVMGGSPLREERPEFRR